MLSRFYTLSEKKKLQNRQKIYEGNRESSKQRQVTGITEKSISKKA